MKHSWFTALLISGLATVSPVNADEGGQETAEIALLGDRNFDDVDYHRPELVDGIYHFDGVNSGFIRPSHVGGNLYPSHNWDRPWLMFGNPSRGAETVYSMSRRGEMTSEFARFLLSCEQPRGCHSETAAWIIESTKLSPKPLGEEWSRFHGWYYSNHDWEAYLLTGDEQFLENMAEFHTRWWVDFLNREKWGPMRDTGQQECVWAHQLRNLSQLASVSHLESVDDRYQKVLDKTRDHLLGRMEAGNAGDWSRSDIWPGRHAHPHIAWDTNDRYIVHPGSQSWVQAWVTNEIARAVLIGHGDWEPIWNYNIQYWLNFFDYGPRKYYNQNLWATRPEGDHEGE